MTSFEMARQKFTICILPLLTLYASLGSGTNLSLLESQFLTITEGTILTLQSGSQEKVHIVKAHEKPWYKEFYTTEPEGARMLWHKFNHAKEIITQDSEHVFKKVRLPFEFQLYGQPINEVTISSAGALLTGDPEDEILIPSHIAPFLAHLAPSKDDEVYYVSDEKIFLVQWSKDIDGTYKNRFEFQAQLSPDGGVIFVYRNFPDQARNAALKSGYPVLIGLQDSFAIKGEKAKDGLTVYTYPSLLVPLGSLFKTSDYSAIVFQSKSNRCRGRQEVFCNDTCSFCKRLNTCVNELEMHRPGMECDKEAQAKNCTKSCPSTWAPVCGSDQVMYSNKCLLQLSACESGKNVVVAHQGVCKSQSEAEDDDQKKCDLSESCSIIDHVCGSDGQTYASECDLRQHNCIVGSKVKVVRNGVCPQQEDDNIGSPDDDEEYEGNGTEEQIDDDSRELPEVAVDAGGSDLEDHDEKNKKCLKDCSKEMKPVCLNGMSNFSNRCVMEVAVCLKSLKVEKVTEGYCSDKKIPEEAAGNQICKGFCTREYRPVCGSDGKTYSNQCNLEFAACMIPGLRKRSEGPCSDEGAPKTDKDGDKCFKACSKILLPVCGTNEVTYSNLCLLEEAQCRDPTLELLHKGGCEETAPGSLDYKVQEEPLELTKNIFEMEQNDKLQLNVNRAFRMAMSCAIGVAVVSMLALFYILLRHQKTVQKSARAMEFQSIATFSDDPPSTVEMDNAADKNRQNKYNKLVFVD